MMHALQARVRQLEADNASLATAAEQAAILAEEYAADAAKYRAANNSSQTALVNELTDATRRKDRRIQRLTALLETEKKRVLEMQCQIEELKDSKKLADENEHKLRESVHVLQDRAVATSTSDLDTHRLPARVLYALEAIFPPDLRGIFAALRVFFMAESVCARTSRITLTQNTEKAGNRFAQLAKVIDETARRAVAWCFESPADLSQRGMMLDEGMSNLEERVEALSREISEGEPHRWTPAYGQMKQDLVVMVIEVIKSVVPASWTSVQEMDKMEFEQICREQASYMKSILNNEEREVQTKIVEDLKSRLNATKLMLEQRNKELDDLRVRSSVFENKLEASLKDKDIITALQNTVKVLEKEFAEAKAAAEQSANLERVTKEESVKAEKEAEKRELPTPVKQMSARESAQHMTETSRLRGMLVQSQLADLHTTSLSKEAKAQLRETMQLRDAVSTALNNARTAASKARIVQLDPQTLKPKTEGATMSRKTLLQSLSALEKPVAAPVQGDVMRFATKRQAALHDAADMVTTLVTIMRELR